MPLPIIHSFAGYSVYRTSRKSQRSRSWTWAALAVLLANLADFDYFAGVFTGDVGRYHRGITHSFGAAVIVSLVVGLVAWLWKKDSFGKAFLFSFAAYPTHVLLYFFEGAFSHMALFWPLTSEKFHPPFHFNAVEPEKLQMHAGLGKFLASMVNLQFLSLLLNEVVIVFLIWYASSVIASLRKVQRTKTYEKVTRGYKSYERLHGLVKMENRGWKIENGN